MSKEDRVQKRAAVGACCRESRYTESQGERLWDLRIHRPLRSLKCSFRKLWGVKFDYVLFSREYEINKCINLYLFLRRRDLDKTKEN